MNMAVFVWERLSEEGGCPACTTKRLFAAAVMAETNGDHQSAELLLEAALHVETVLGTGHDRSPVDAAEENLCLN